MVSIKSAALLFLGAWFIGITGTHVAQDDGLEIPTDLQVLSVENAANLEIIGEFSVSGDAIFTSPSMDTLFAVSHRFEGSSVTAYTFPELQQIIEFPAALRPSISVNTQRYPMESAFFTPDKDQLLFMRGSKGISLFDILSQTAVVNENLWVSDAFDISSEGMLAITHFDFRTEEKFLCFIDLRTFADAPQDWQCQTLDESVVRMAFFDNGKQLLLATTKRLILFDAVSSKITKTFPFSLTPYDSSLALLPSINADDNLPTVFLAQDGYVLRVDLATNAQSSFPNGMNRTAENIIPLDEGKRILFLVPSEQGNYSTIMILDTATKQLLLSVDIFGGEQVLLSSDKTLAVLGNELYDLQTFQPLFTFGGDDHPMSFTPDGRMLFIWNSTDDRVQVYGVTAD